MNMISKIRKGKLIRLLAAFIAINMLVEIVSPTTAFALTTGPSQPEVQSFEPVSTSDMVNLFSGDFTYNIPLFELPGPDGGYPFNLAYHSGIGMEQEASWVGLGWNINPGALTRQMRGVPDEFKGDEYKYEMDMKSSQTFGINASASMEIWGSDLSKATGGEGNGALSLSTSLYYNNYRGFGYSLGSGVSFRAAHTSIGLNMDSQGGTSVSMDFSASHELSSKSNTSMNVGVGISLSSKAGLQGSLSSSLTKKSTLTGENAAGKKITNDVTKSLGTSSTLSSATLAYSSYNPMATRANHLNVSFRTGGDLAGAFTNFSIGGFFNTTYAKDKNSSRKAYGLFYAQKRTKDGLQDFNREREKSVHRDDKTFPIPVSTPDFYSFTGQGIGGMFRTFRSDIGNFHDPYTKSTTDGGSFGFEVGPGQPNHIGVTGTYTHGQSEVGKWNVNGGAYDFNNYGEERNDKEISWFALNGEMVAMEKDELDWIGGEKAVTAKMQKKGSTEYVPVANTFIDKSKNQITLSNQNRQEAGFNKRKRRGTLIQQVTNGLLLDGNNELMSEYKVGYYSSSVDVSDALDVLAATETSYLRGTKKSHHFAGFSVHQPNGQRYVYGIPAYNNKQIESSFSVPDEDVDCIPRVDVPIDGSSLKYKHNLTNEFLMRTEIPEYAHSYLLTGILGNDYIDVLDDGITDDDYGYWVKFNYAKIHDNFNWRMPFKGARYNKGSYSLKEDNKGSFIYGEKEIWYLTSVETRTHVAVFELNDRMDGIEAPGELAGLSASLSGLSKLKKIKSIKLYSKLAYQNAVSQSTLSSLNPIQTIHFEYDYSLCEGVENNNGQTDPNDGDPISNDGGKLTLKKVYMTYEGNQRGALSPYEFNYSNVNPDYDEFAMDRWGNYKQSNNEGDYCSNIDMPYVSQYDVSTGYTKTELENFRENEVDDYANAWHLNEIITPTGGKISIEYESDDYSYVQHRKATQMFQINGLKKDANDGLTTYTYESNQINNRVEFNLEVPIAADISYYADKYQGISDPDDVLEQHYLKGLERRGEHIVYFKTYANLRDNLWDYVNGYAKVVDWGVTGETAVKNINGSNLTAYTKGYLVLEDVEGYNPFAAAVFQHMRTNEPILLNYNTAINGEPGTSDFEKAARVKSLLSFITEIPKMFTKFRNFCRMKGFGNKIDPAKTVIKLTSPDGVKYGGGTRVKAIRMSDEFPVNGSSAEYGQVYSYTMNDPKNPGLTISSGVASYEPQIGGDENALRYAESFYTEGTGKNTSNQRYVEMPINESYFPGASVGYEQVEVMSLNTANVVDGQTTNVGDPTGVSVHKFYTAREFPTMVEKTNRTENTGKARRLWIPIPFIGQIETNRMHASQGYAVQTNDMHGKQKSISNYGISKAGNIVWEAAISKVEYDYKKKLILYDETAVYKLENKVNTIRIVGAGDHYFDHVQDEMLLGVQYEFFSDQRWSKSYSNMGGLEFNTEILTVYPIPIPWPSVNSSTNELGLWITNKVIHRSGIQHKTVATDGQSTVTTENLAFDAYTGKPLYTRTKNNWDNNVYGLQDVYNYPAVSNLGYQFISGLQTVVGPGSNDVSVDLMQITETGKELYPGDELILIDESGNRYKATVVHDLSMQYATQHADEGSYLEVGSRLIYGENLPVSPSGEYNITVVRSGHRNILNLPAHGLTALSDPLNSDNRIVGNLDDEFTGIRNVLNASAVNYTDKWSKLNEDNNPYKNGLRGILRKQNDLFYAANRKQSSGLVLGQDGIYQDDQGGVNYYYPAILPWNFYDGDPMVLGMDYATSTNKDSKDTWYYGSTTTQFDAYGNEIESTDPLGIFSSAKYGYKGSLPIWVAANAYQKEVLFDGFETIDETGLQADNGESYNPLDETFIVDEEAHTGKRSLRVQSPTLDVRSDLELEGEKEYVISAWVKADETDFTYNHEGGDNISIEVRFYDQNRTTILGSVVAIPVGEVIEGWQQVALQFETPNDPAFAKTDFYFYTGNQYAHMWVDDLRIFPANGNMQSYVYDANNYRLQATLDQNNFASFYYYDEAGNLYLVKKETERGIFTISESTSHKQETN